MIALKYSEENPPFYLDEECILDYFKPEVIMTQGGVSFFGRRKPDEVKWRVRVICVQHMKAGSTKVNIDFTDETIAMNAYDDIKAAKGGTDE